MNKILSFTMKGFTDYLKINFGKGEYHAKCIYRYFFKTGSSDFENLDCFKNKELAIKIKKSLVFPSPLIADIKESEQVLKFALKLDDGKVVESVILKMKNRHTLCISSQAGCRMNCRFCATGKTGLQRNLFVDEIIIQFFTARFILGYNIRNVVFMGMGEPLDNYENVKKSVLVLNEQHGFDLSFRHITISTSGIADKIAVLGKDKDIRPNLSVSINSADNEKRKYLMPVSKKYSLGVLKQTLLDYPLKKKGIIFITYTLFKGLNDSIEDAEMLVRYLEGLPCRVNLIPYNPVKGCDFEKSSDDDINRFASYLEKDCLFVRKRWTRGAELDAGCGQLAAEINL
ncbi:MAG: 23S rRNA (adenine(2503)-C(2))-methyltransferase RlmN [Deltaproteobacteria bacterium]|nr:MAG: 23S rRNA (adenine(2503)-C(2))-methyltransferase RlmN [Deltaproteobacteria bacterium]PIE74921.1 MAG: 23S rRNA (adenine(2503)-C(2))-methyltransferase RlmN [Deltaproteobacteria bacterium]